MIYPVLIYKDERGNEYAEYKTCPEGFNLLEFTALQSAKLIRLMVYRGRRDAETIVYEINHNGGCN